jgi:triosephosphate isomerase
MLQGDNMRLPIIAGNWKMNTTVEEATKLVEEMRDRLDGVKGVEKVLCPPFISLVAVRRLLQGSSIELGAQNMHFEEKGAYTGEVSPLMLVGWCRYVILGHSERRQYFGETDEVVNKKLKAALKAGLSPILCVGERLEENEAGKTEEVVTRQVRGALAEIESPRGMVIAYEPVWAIGTGKAATGEQANATIGLIRRLLAQLYGEDFAQAMRIQYGGSVTTANIAEFVSQPEIDGALVGGASLKAKEFLGIVEQTAAIKRG